MADRTEPCSCGTGWVEDENWQPDDPQTWRGERSEWNGLIPCGLCNHGGETFPEAVTTDG